MTLSFGEAWSIPLAVGTILGVIGFVIQYLVRRGILK